MMLVKYTVPESSDVIVGEFSSACLHKFAEEDGTDYIGWGIAFMSSNSGLVLRVRVPNFSDGAEILDSVYANGKIDLSANLNVVCENCTIDIDDALSQIIEDMYDDEDDCDGE